MSRSGQLVRDARSAAGLTQRELATRSGVAPTLISAYENGRRVPGGDALLRLLDACGAHIDVGAASSHDRRAAAGLEQVVAVAMMLPRREPGPLAFPSFRSLIAQH